MKAHLSVFALSAIIIASIGMAPAFGQIQDPIVVATDKSSYKEGETILVTGEVKALLGGEALSLIVTAPNGNIVTVDQLTVGSDKKFSTELTAGGSLMRAAGTYTITVQYGNQSRTAETTFSFSGSSMIPSTGTGKVTGTQISIEGSDEMIGYKITGGKLLSVTPDVDANSLIIAIEATNDGTLTLTIPRSIMDATINGEDDTFFVLVDGEEVDFEEKTTSKDRTLTINFLAGAEEIEIIGTFVVPEFGTIAVMILAVAIISIIAVSAKSRLSIMPRY
ncbi:PEFG-CTERM sorting domain-containing protein [Nitrosopumilus sp. K4]|uniref:PEFG-CTERM sorting domain-containing protein n=1 Tax=Nitrosopumilus sp. K4 TaxID=2795383 RepID=UPI001BA67A6D|nr:PEFG-CTERM sorting domain-containing protein [Nitrosopumilus sp. K4]QUC64191.1 PEFG-CTERM sorting domain-containing protein [Nitrosopumilus sp. K4]